MHTWEEEYTFGNQNKKRDNHNRAFYFFNSFAFLKIILVRDTTDWNPLNSFFAVAQKGLEPGLAVYSAEYTSLRPSISDAIHSSVLLIQHKTPSGFFMCGIRESNPCILLGKQTYCHCINPAFVSKNFGGQARKSYLYFNIFWKLIYGIVVVVSEGMMMNIFSPCFL